MRTSNLAILFTDIKGFTERTGRQSHAENQRMLRIHDGLLMPVFRAFEGRMVKTIGDAFLVVFQSPTRAVLAGAAIQDRLHEYNRKARPGDRIEVRVAINLGEVREEKGDVFGEPVNIAARVEGIADAGEVVFTEAVYLAMNRAEVPAEEHGVHQLKGISTPIRLWRVPARGDDKPFGGLGLSRAGKLPSTDPDELERHEGELVHQLLARAEGLQRAIAPVASKLAGSGALVPKLAGPLARKGREQWERIPAAKRGPVLAVTLLAVAFAAWVATRGDAVERAVDRGDLREARKLAQAMPAGPRKAFDEGRIDEARAAFGAATSHYAEAARGGERKGFQRLVRLTRDSRCQARQSAAAALGRLGNDDAKAPLQRLLDGSFPDEGEDSTFGAILGCSSRRAARDALNRLQDREESGVSR